MAGRSRRGVSPIIATLLLIVIAVAGAVITYAFVTGLIGGAAPQAPSAAISVDSITSNDSHVLIYVRNTGTAQALVNRVYVEQGGSLVAVEDVSVAIAPGTVGNVAVGKGALSSGTVYVFKIFCGGNTMPTAYSSNIGGGAGPAPMDTTPPGCSGTGTNTTLSGMPCLFSSTWSDNVALSGFIFSTNMSGGWANSSWSAFIGNVGSALAMLPSAGTVVGYRFYANDTSDNWSGSGVQSLTTGEYIWIPQNTTVITGYTDPITAPSGSWLNPSYAYADGGNYASTTTTLVTQQWGTYGFDLPSNTTEISNIVIRYDAWSNSAVAEYTEMYAMINENGTGWLDYNMTLNLGVPAEAVAEIVLASAATSAARTLGVRTDGSSIDRYIKLAEAEGGGNRTATMLVKVASNGLIETYCSSTSGANFILIGYWVGVDYTELIASWTAGTASAWTDYDLMATGVPASGVAQIFIGNRDNDAAQTGGVRNPASSLSRYASIHEAESSSTEYTDYGGYTTFVKSNSTGYVQYYGTSTSYLDFIVLGYFGSGIDYVELWTQKMQGTGWVEHDLTSDLDEDGRVVNFILGHGVNNAEHYLGIRNDGSSLERTVRVVESESNDYEYVSMSVESSSGGIVEGYTSNADEYFWLAGYFKPVAVAIRVDVSYDGGLSWVAFQETALATSETAYTYDVGSLRTWSYSELSDSNFRVRATAVISGQASVRLDWVPANITYAYDTSHWEYITTP